MQQFQDITNLFSLSVSFFIFLRLRMIILYRELLEAFLKQCAHDGTRNGETLLLDFFPSLKINMNPLERFQNF